MTYQEALDWGREELHRAQVADFDLDADYLMEFVSQKGRVELLMAKKETIAPEFLERYRKLIARRANRVPLQQICQRAYFMGLAFYVNEHVLCPRQDTEILVEEALRIIGQCEEKPLRLLDLCTGTGCILLSILDYARREGRQIEGLGIDLSEQALLVAKENARRLGIEACFSLSDIFSHVNGHFDLITANPPYIPSDQIETLMPEVCDHEPRMALDGENDGLAFYRRIIKEAPNYLSRGGQLILEIGYDQAKAVTSLLGKRGFSEITLIQDLGGNDRVLCGRYRDV